MELRDPRFNRKKSKLDIHLENIHELFKKDEYSFARGMEESIVIYLDALKKEVVALENHLKEII